MLEPLEYIDYLKFIIAIWLMLEIAGWVMHHINKKQRDREFMENITDV